MEAIKYSEDIQIKKLTLLGLCLLCSLTCWNTASWANDTDTDSPNRFSDNLRFTLDASSRAVYFSRQNQTGFMHAFGFDLHKVFSGQQRDIGTLVLQGYLTRIDNFVTAPAIFDDPDDTEFVYRIFNFNYTGLPGNWPNLRIGHFEVAYGLEHAIDTNGTLRQYQQGANLGIKADWGVSLNKQLTSFEYEIGATSGGNQELDSDDGSFVYSARIGTPRDENTVLGLAVYKSELNNLKRERLGVDVRYYHGLHGFFAEVSTGENNETDVLNLFGEWNYRNSTESLLYYTQLSYLSIDVTGNSALKGIVGVKYAPDNHWSLSTQYARDINVFVGKKHQGLFNLQLRYRF